MKTLDELLDEIDMHQSVGAEIMMLESEGITEDLQLGGFFKASHIWHMIRYIQKAPLCGNLSRHLILGVLQTS